MAPSTKSPLTPFDELFLVVEDDAHLMTVASVYKFSTERPTPAVIRSQLEDFARSTICCHRVVDTANRSLFRRSQWREVDVNIDQHFRVVELPDSAIESLNEEIGKELSTKFDFSKPLWEAVLYVSPTDTMLFLKAHHCISDGQGFVRNLLRYVASLDPTIDRTKVQYSASRAVSKEATTNGVKDSKKPKPPLMVSLLRRLQAFFIGLLAIIAGMVPFLINLANFMTSHRRSFSRSSKTSKKQIGMSTGLRLDDIKAIKNTLNVSVNDVLVGCLSLAIERYLDDRGAVKDANGFWFLIPTSMRAADDWSVSNKSSAYTLNVAVNNPTKSEAIKSLSQRMKAKKNNPEPVINYNFIYLSFLYNFIPTSLANFFAPTILSVITNVPGPNININWAGERIDEIWAFAPQAYPNSLGCAIFTYGGRVALSVFMDKDDNDVLYATGSAQRIAHEFETVFRELMAEAKAA